MKPSIRIALLLLALSFLLPVQSALTQSAAQAVYTIQPGDTWPALIWRFGLRPADLRMMNKHINRQRQPTIGSELLLPIGSPDRNGKLIRSGFGGLLQIAALHFESPWLLAMRNGLESPYQPLFLRPLFIPGGSEPPRDLPTALEGLELSQLVAQPGQAVAVRALITLPGSISVQLDGQAFDVFAEGPHLVALAATGAFFSDSEPDLTIQRPGMPTWSQPWRFTEGAWDFQQITLSGAAAAIDQQSIAQEQARLFELWSIASPVPAWDRSFNSPINSYLEISSTYGARRSYNGGPYRTYHEGVDFAAYGGTPVFAPAAGTVILAETLNVRGNAVIIDHGLGVFSGYYHLSTISMGSGDLVQPGALLGEVGTTGLSTGNHLHWDLLVADTWVDAASWLDQDLACWLLVGLGHSCLVQGE